jgi:hypothetical protein
MAATRAGAGGVAGRVDKADVAEKCKQTAVELVDALSDAIFTDGVEARDMLGVRIYLETREAWKIAEGLVEKMLPHAAKIAARDENFFRRNLDLFGELGREKVQHYANAIADPTRVDAENREVVWKYIDVLVHLAVQFKKAD